MSNAPAFPPALDLRAAHNARLESSRRAILDAIGAASDVTLVRNSGNLGDQLISAGARHLLANVPYREVSLEEGCRSSGGTALLTGSGAWCQPFHEIMPAALGVLETRYERVIVLPSSFDVSVKAVRRALERTKALVFARERESYRQIATICRAQLAHDSSFFFDYAPYCLTGSGVLHAYRDDAEATGASPLERDNRDISVTLSSLDEWLWTIARHAEVHTDRAHIMIAAALLGKEVEFYPSSYHKLPAIAEYALSDFPVFPGRRRLPAAPAQVLGPSLPEQSGTENDTATLRRRLVEKGRESLLRLPGNLLDAGEPRVTIVVLSWNRSEQTRACIDSIADHVQAPYRLLVIDNGSERAVRDELAKACQRHTFAELHLLETNLGCAGGRQLAASRVDTEYIAFVDDDAEVFPGTIEHLIHALDELPQTLVAGAKIVLPNGSLQFCGGDYRVHDGIITFEPLSSGRAFDDPETQSEECGWVGGTTSACRTSLFADFPLDLGMSTYFEDNEWCYRIDQSRPGSCRTVPEALVLHHHESKERRGSAPSELVRALTFIGPMAHFYAKHGLIQEDLFGFVPELTMPDGTRDMAAARLLLELVAARGEAWTALHWLQGGLDPLFARRSLMAWTSSKWGRLASFYWSARRRLRGLVGSDPAKDAR